MEQRLTIRQVSQRLRISIPTTLRLVSSGRLRGINVGCGARRARWIVREVDLERFENSRASTVAPKQRQQPDKTPDYFPHLA